MNEVLKCLLDRRSIRRYKKDQIKEADLQEILKAGLYAPNAGGGQRVVFAVIQDVQVNETLGQINREAFRITARGNGFFVSKEQPSIADDTAILSSFYGAPTVITLFAAGNYNNNTADCAVAAENMMLAAYSLGIGSCMVARAEETFSSTYGQEILKKLNVGNEHKAYCHVLLGYPDSEWPKAKPRNEGRIIRLL